MVNARAKATSIQATPELVNDPKAFQKFAAAQDQLSGALSRLLVTVEKYPDLKATAGFRDLQAQLEGTENRITVARGRYIETVQGYNTLVRSFPSNFTADWIGAEIKPNFEARADVGDTPPEVVFLIASSSCTPGFVSSTTCGGHGLSRPISRLALLLATTLSLIAGAATAVIDVPPLKAQVQDNAGLLSAAEEQSLISRLKGFEAETQHQIVVLTVPSLEGEAIESFTLRVAEAWKIGQAKIDNGVVVVVSLQGPTRAHRSRLRTRRRVARCTRRSDLAQLHDSRVSSGSDGTRSRARGSTQSWLPHAKKLCRLRRSKADGEAIGVTPTWADSSSRQSSEPFSELGSDASAAFWQR